MKGPGLKRKLSLRIVHQGEEITGLAPLALERATKGSRPGSEDHRALIHTLATVAGYAARQTMPPSAARLMLSQLEVAHAWVIGAASTSHVSKARSEAFESIVAAEKRTTESVSQSMALMKRKAETGLDRHAATVVLRYAALAANYACGATILTLDAVSDPTKGLNLVTQAAGAVSYQRLALGPALGSELRAAAWSQAEWEASRRGAPDVYPAGALAVQLFHEFLGAQWKDQSDGMRSYFEDFINWALPHLAPS
ncbi:MAG: hypothetical protein KIT72_19865 [Polyangiaceae bacterium]|nr:hypothetical protein [Polyangiaceae bacterium]MCW5792679.1 hypothetical protein [Polyangiaceae bacterium]